MFRPSLFFAGQASRFPFPFFRSQQSQSKPQPLDPTTHSMNLNPNRQDPDDTAALPVRGNPTERRFNSLWFLLLLLIPLLMLPFCHHRDADRTNDTATDASTPVSTVAANVVNPFTANSTGADAGKAVLNFDVNTTTPNASAVSVLNGVVAYLQANPSTKVSLKGFTDNSGSAEVNKRLTQQRINAVKTALTGAGIDADRISATNFGEAYPITDNSNPQARELNRRVEVELAK